MVGIQIQSSAQEQTVFSLEVVHQYFSVVLFDPQQYSLELIALQHYYFSLIVAAVLLRSSLHSLNPLKMW